MNLLPGTTVILTSTAYTIDASPCRVYCVHVVSGTTSGTLKLLNKSASAGTEFVQLDGTANQGNTFNFNGGLYFPNGCYATPTSWTTYSTIVYSREQ